MTLRLALAALLVAVTSSACTSKKEPPVATHSSLADSADQIMYGRNFILTNDGLQRAKLVFDTAFFFDDNTRIEFFKVNMTFYTVTGAKDAVLTSERGTYNSRTNAMIARKNVVVVTEDGRRLTTPELLYSQQINQISSDSAFVLTEPNRTLAGIGFRSDPDMKNIRILKGATGVVRGLSTESPTPTASSTPSTTPPRR